MTTNDRAPILLVEDEADIRELIVLHLKRAGYQVLEALDGDQARTLLSKGHYQTIILDWMLPGVSGMELLKTIRDSETADRKVPVLMVTARATTSDVVLGLESGADDYLTKPFEPVILMARLRSILRRTDPPQSNILQVGDLKVDSKSHRAFLGENEIHLTPSEFKLLCSLITNRGRVLTRDQLIELVQGEGVAVVDRAVDTHVFGLRKKLGESGSFIETVRGIGYRIGGSSE